MPLLARLIEFLDTVCPPALAESWDNTGLLLGDRSRPVRRVMTCLTLSPETVREAVAQRADVVVSHHPFPFRAEKKWTADTPTGAILLQLVEEKIGVYSPHTAHDSALFGVNRQLAERLGLTDILPLEPQGVAAEESMLAGLDGATATRLAEELDEPLGSGRIGRFIEPVRLGELLRSVRQMLNLACIQSVGDADQRIETVAVACGAADGFIPAAVREGADAMLLGETKYHQALEAQQAGLSLILPGHFATERFAVETLAARIAEAFEGVVVWGAVHERDPFRYDFAPDESAN